MNNELFELIKSILPETILVECDMEVSVYLYNPIGLKIIINSEGFIALNSHVIGQMATIEQDEIIKIQNDLYTAMEKHFIQEISESETILKLKSLNKN